MLVLLDTHALLWWREEAAFSFAAGVAVLKARSERNLLVSVISAWEIGVADTKLNPLRRPPLGGLSPEEWFEAAVASLQPTMVDVSLEIAR